MCFMLLINYFIGFAELKDEDENRIQRGMDNWNGKCTGDWWWRTQQIVSCLTNFTVTNQTIQNILMITVLLQKIQSRKCCYKYVP